MWSWGERSRDLRSNADIVYGSPAREIYARLVIKCNARAVESQIGQSNFLTAAFTEEKMRQRNGV